MPTAAATSTAPDNVRTRATGPIRTCIGCRRRAAATELLRIAAATAATETDSVPVVPDPRRRIEGRGAWLHPDPRCVEAAERRRAVGRALRVSGRVETSSVYEYVARTGPGPDHTSGDERSE